MEDGDADRRRVLMAEERTLAMTKNRAQRLGFALMLLFYRTEGRFPDESTETDPAIVAQVAHQIGVPVTSGHSFDSASRTGKRHRTEIRSLFGFREASVADAGMLTAWLCEQAATEGGMPDHLTALLTARCRELLIEPPSIDRVDRIVRDAINDHDDRFCEGIMGRLSPVTRARLEALLRPAENEVDGLEGDQLPETPHAVLHWLRSDPGRPSLANVQEELAKLELIRRLDLPRNLFDHAPPHDLDRYRQCVAVEAPYELRRHAEAARLTWLAAFAYLRGRTLTDNVADLLVETIHHIGARAERKVESELLDDLKRVTGKQNLLFEIADAALGQPDGMVREVVFPVVDEQTLHDLVKEWKATGPTYRTTLRTVIRNSYKGHYRRMVPKVLAALDFRSNNEQHRPVIRALDLIKRYADTNLRLFPADEDVPVDGIASGLWRDAVVEKDAGGRSRINRITYEICVLEALREKLRCKEIWVAGANRYRNPDEDLPADFETQRAQYYKALNLPLDPDRFITDLQTEMRKALRTLDSGLPGNRFVRIKESGSISLTPFDPQPEPPNLAALKAEVSATWPMTSLLDMVKETDLRLNFTGALRSPTAYETMDRSVLQPRLLLCLHGLGTNAGLQRMAGIQSGMTYKDLAYVRRRYISVDALRSSIATVANGTLHARDPAIWGEGTTACASDSKHFGAWDQNLTTQWHARYGGRGVMIYVSMR